MIQPINPENLQKRAKGRPRKEIRKTAAVTLWMEPWLKSLMIRKNVTAQKIRDFIKDFGKGLEMPEDCIRSDDWQSLLKMIEASPALLLTGDINSGKSFLMQKTIENSPYVFQVIDTHHEYDKLPVVTKISRDVTLSVRILPPRQADAARGVFQMYKNVILAQPFPKNHILVIEEAGRYGDDAKQILMESRKFVKTIFISQEKAWDFCPHVKVWPYNKVDIKKILKGGEK